MCDTPIARITSCVSSLRISVGDSPYNYSVAIRVNRMILVSLCAETVKPVIYINVVKTKIYGITTIFGLRSSAVQKMFLANMCNNTPLMTRGGSNVTAQAAFVINRATVFFPLTSSPYLQTSTIVYQLTVMPAPPTHSLPPPSPPLIRDAWLMVNRRKANNA